MQNLLNVGTILGVTLGVVTTMLVLFPLLKKKGIKVDEVLQKVDMALNGADAVITVADKIMPVNPVLDTLKVVEKYGHIGVHQAEQLCINSKLGKDERNAKSKETIYAALKLLNIEPTEEIDTIINGIIEAETLALGHKNLTEVEKQAQLQKVQARATQLQTENVQLKQTIATIQGAVQVAQ
ncbi:hypothetical protein E4V42_13390 [Clostridium estertheticum]|uniref:Uncharacterized protein n=1 Tax=Clostridium estertheticum TaxID=238834 RepID=A0A5N7J2W5_9CLOT|nr:hypothetical protein [Clostridium estertheticum]MPQ32426.1 hypothetical protein [Clostridium estertheticum]MPQ63085.1 hypothetical protein [Clostridium estertheticum]